MLRCGPIQLDTGRQSVSRNDETIELTAYEYKVLEYLMLNNDQVVSKSDLSEHVYDEDVDPDSNVLEVLIARLRRKLDPNRTLNPIATLRGRGYRFVLAPSSD